MALSDLLFGSSAKTQQLPTSSPQQMALQNQLGQQANRLIPGLMQGFNFEPIREQAMRGFNQNIVPGLADRFTSLSSSGGGALSSPAFASQLGQAGANLSGDLAALQSRLGLQQQAQQQGLLQSLLGAGLRPQFENLHTQRQPGALEGGLQGLLSLLPLLLFGGSSSASNATTGLGMRNQQPQSLLSSQGSSMGALGQFGGGGMYAPQAGLLSGLLSGLGGY